MPSRRLFIAAAIVVAVSARASVPDLINSIAATAYPGASVFSVPSGLGSPFTAARAAGGFVVDATITLSLYDAELNPVAHYPREDIWLESAHGHLAFPILGTAPDTNTDENGQTRWTVPMQGGGCTTGDVWVIVAGLPLTSTLDLKLNSADMNGDLAVNLLDLALFGPLIGGSDYCGDFNHDGQVNAIDIEIFSLHFPWGVSSYTYEPCRYRMGLFFSQDLEFTDQWFPNHANIDYAPGVPFYLHVVAIGCASPISGYEARLVIDPSFAVEDLTVAGSGQNYGNALTHRVTYPLPQSPIGGVQAVLLSTLTILPSVDGLASVMALGPPDGSSIGGDGPAVIVDGGFIRVNFTPYSHSGCADPLAPGDFPDYVATTYGSGIITNLPQEPLPGVPAALAISSVAPNPFNPRTTVSFELRDDAEISLRVYDGRGRLIRTLLSERRDAGWHRVDWEGCNAAGETVPSGIYLFRLETAGGLACAAKTTLVR
jgi:hypothetical protein